MRRMKLNDFDKKFRKEHHLKFIMNMRWAKLTRGEKLVRVAVKLTRFALIAAVIAVIASIIIGAVLGVFVAFAMASAISGGLRNAGRANTNHLYGLYKW